jgi:hypothetical protein
MSQALQKRKAPLDTELFNRSVEILISALFLDGL